MFLNLGITVAELWQMITGERKKPIEGFENSYEVTETGKIYSLNNYVKDYDYLPLLSTRIDRGGYLTVRLNERAQTHTKFLHRLIALAFIPNPDNKKYINHKSGNKLDNRVNNLEWTDHSENISHAYSTGLIKSKGKAVIDSSTGEIFSNAQEASKRYGINYNTLRNYLNGNIRTNPTSLSFLG